MKILLYKFTKIKSKTDIQTRIIILRNDETIREYKKGLGQDKDGEDVPKLESVEDFLVHCNLVNNNYQQASKVLFTYVQDKQYGHLINILPHSLTKLSKTNAVFSSIEVWFIDQNFERLEIEDNVNMTPIIG